MCGVEISSFSIVKKITFSIPDIWHMQGVYRPMEVFILLRNCVLFCVVKVICVVTKNNNAVWAQHKHGYVKAPDISVVH